MDQEPSIEERQKYLSEARIKIALDQFTPEVFETIFKSLNLADVKYVRQGIYSHDDDESSWHRKTSQIWCNIPTCNTKFDTVFAYEKHYNALHRFLCSQCKKRLPSAHLLDLHLSEKHDFFFAAQAERKPMFACYLEECLHKSSTPADRRDHCITEHKFPHNFRFDGYSHLPKKGKSACCDKKMSNDGNETMDVDATCSLPPTHKVQDQRKSVGSFCFGHGQTKSFLPNNDSYAKKLTKNKKFTKKNKVLEDKKMVQDLLESLPEN